MRLNFKRLYLLCGKAARELAHRAGLTPARVDLMMLLLKTWRSQRELALVLCVHPSVVSRMVKALVQGGLVRSDIDPNDRRIRAVVLTAAGRERLQPCFGAPPLLDPDGARNAQCAGERVWLADWRQDLARHGARIGWAFRSIYPPFFALRDRNAQNPYADIFSPPPDWQRALRSAQGAAISPAATASSYAAWPGVK